jgi:hypothetical protein
MDARGSPENARAPQIGRELGKVGMESQLHSDPIYLFVASKLSNQEQGRRSETQDIPKRDDHARITCKETIGDLGIDESVSEMEQ